MPGDQPDDANDDRSAPDPNAPVSLYDLDRQALTDALADQPRYRSDQVWDGLYRRAAKLDEITDLPASVRRQLATAHWFRLDAARRDLGYEPTVSLDEGMARLATWLAEGGRASSVP